MCAGRKRPDTNAQSARIENSIIVRLIAWNISAFLLKLNATRQNLAGVCLSTLQAYVEWSEKEVFEVWRAVILT